MARNPENVNVDWHTTSRSIDNVQLEVLMDVRAELKHLNALLHCQNAVDIPNILRRIDKNTRKPKRRKPTSRRGNK